VNLTIFAGTFNPIHTAHLIMAEAVRTELSLEKILFIPSFIPPQKNNGLVSPEHRLNMVKLAVQDNPHFEVSDIELKLDGVSYTYNTVSELYRQNPDVSKINFIIGTDAFNNIESWYKSDELAKMLDFVVLSRPNSEKIHKEGYNYRFVDAPEIDISSSLIRGKIKQNKSIKYLVPKQVEDYIKENGLYLD
jgi:nicotinate-nucleotide adenylyltransferase